MLQYLRFLATKFRRLARSIVLLPLPPQILVNWGRQAITELIPQFVSLPEFFKAPPHEVDRRFHRLGVQPSMELPFFADLEY